MLNWFRCFSGLLYPAAAKSLQSCPTLCDPIDSSPPGSSVPGILQARILEWAAISFSNAWKWKVKGKSFGRVRLLGPHALQPTRLLHPWDFLGKSTGVGCHCLLWSWEFPYKVDFFKFKKKFCCLQCIKFSFSILENSVLWKDTLCEGSQQRCVFFNFFAYQPLSHKTKRSRSIVSDSLQPRGM